MPLTRLSRSSVASAALIALAAATLPARQAPDATLLAAAHRALGGDDKLAAVTTFTVSGSIGRSVGPTVSVEYKCALPDRFVRIEHQSNSLGPLGTSDVTYITGFNGDDPIQDQIVNSPIPFPSRPPDPTTPDGIAKEKARRLVGAKRIFSELTLPMFIGSFAAFPLDLTSSSQVSLPSGPADVLDVKGPDGRTRRLYLDATSHLPVRVTWMAKPIVTRTTSSSSTFTTDSRGRVVSPPSSSEPMPVPVGDPTAGLADVEWQMDIAEYKTADGLTWPHRLTTSYAGKKYEDTRLGKFSINPKINPSVFKPTK